MTSAPRDKGRRTGRAATQEHLDGSMGEHGAIPERGQGLVEFAFLLPIFLVLLLGMLEFGFAFTHNLTLQYATREGARVGSALVNGGGTLGCGSGLSPNRADVDPLIIAAVERVLTSPGSAVQVANIPSIRIFKATAAGTEAGPVNVWTYAPLGYTPSPPVPGLTQPLRFAPPGSPGWLACSRSNATASPGPDSIGVSLTYSYQFTTGLKAISGFFGGGLGPTIPMADRTVMSLNPTNQ